MYRAVHVPLGTDSDKGIGVTESKQRLLDAAIAHVTEHGVRDLTLRGLAAAIGTSHRMLIYHFGSRDGLLVEVVRVVEDGTRDLYARLADEMRPDDPQTELPRRFWHAVTEPAISRLIPLYFELYGRAVVGDPGAAPMLDGLVGAWQQPMTDMLIKFGVPAEEATVHARLGIAVTRGLLMDYLASGDLDACTKAMDEFIDRYGAFGVPPRTA
jgi:AcrR family transcriptional regulator